ncbi:ATP synthase F1 subunit gamma [Ruminococcus champanellensis]|uniref:ATP synthase gamma chain n=1 Tax=Ruminococcus champanellensis (strain DSM 18848 / JCM 17042 / KCTC 15320 / 18P13) TaxID=213810 RepID=D4LBD7_RUMC1|nr:ATP synthase F1 subunit gamma [Ruminococcus champanellensis]CBL16932.1 ATP synthase F1 subcomplex gamma subunit [Ruminococcus champanellensis 18P13 = JCM 17042]
MATANLKDIKRRIKSVESTMQITKAMELVASSKLRRAKEKAERAEPFFNMLYQMMCQIVAESGDFQSTFLQHHTGGAVLLIAIAGDRGLAGGFNSNVFKQVQIRMEELQTAGREPVVIAIGRKAVEYFQRRNVRILAEFENIGEDITVYKALDIAERIVTLYEKGDIQAVELIYTNYVSPLVQEAHHMHVMPVEHLEYAPGGYHALTTYEPSPEAVFDALIPKYLAGMLYCAVIESFAAEQAARRLAMENATDNATEMITDLSLVYNRARQSAITQEITEIVSGANAQS